MARSPARAEPARRSPKPTGGRPRRRAVGASRAPRPRPTLAEPPHAHIVCQQCGRISEIPLTPAQRASLVKLTGGRPSGWSVNRLAFSLTGLCPRCRSPPPAA